MAIAALVISIFSLLAATASAFYAWKIASIERDRQHEEKTPTFKGFIETKNPQGTVHWYTLNLRLESASPLTGIKAIITEGNGIWFWRGVKGVDPSEPMPVRTATWDAMTQGEVALWRVELEPERDEEIRVLVICKGSDDAEWTTLVPVKIPPRGGRVIGLG